MQAVLCLFLFSGCASKAREYVVNKPVSDVYNVLASLQHYGSEAGSYSHAANSVVIKREIQKSVTFKLASSEDSEGSTIRLEFTPLDGGNATSVRAHYDVVPFSLDGDMEFASEFLVRKLFGLKLESLLLLLEDGSDMQRAAWDFNTVMMGISLVTNPVELAKAKRLPSLFFEAKRGSRVNESNIDYSSRTGAAMYKTLSPSDAGPMVDPDYEASQSQYSY